MITFWIFAIAMVVIAMIFLLRPFFRDTSKNDIDRAAQNVGIAKERINELKVDFDQGNISQAEYDTSLQEHEQSLLDDVEQNTTLNAVQVDHSGYNKISRIILMFTVPAMAFSLYTYLGKPELIEGGQKQMATVANPLTPGSKDIPSVTQMVEKLAAKLKEKPNNAEGWFMLGRSYMNLKRYTEAANAYAKANQLVVNNPVILLRYADALTMVDGGKINKKAFFLITKAVDIEPDAPSGLWLLGMGYSDKGEYKKAISSWERLRPLINDEKSIAQVNNLINKAKRKLGIKVDSTKTKAFVRLKVKVSIDKSMLQQVSLDDTVFIFAKAVDGPPMPLAVVRKQVKDLPFDIVLDDSMAMIPNMTLSSFKEVYITARVAKTGNPLKQKGDLYSKKILIKIPFTESINIKINLIAK